ncbi:MAG TPA: hypothetical protein VGS19_27925 [Streptosporangiaceae bacterium]|nr:hypothetical protein [Streptosporangiaceae bacterium]
MRTYTNLAWPDDPYRTGQQPYPRPTPRLAAFAMGQTTGSSLPEAQAAAVVYLPLHRPRSVAITT